MRIGTLVTALGLALVSATASAQTVTYDYDKGTDFSKLKTYAWIDGITLRDELNHKRIVSAIETQLGAKGLTKVALDSNPDVLVAYHAAFERNFEINAFSSGYGGPWVGGNRSGSARLEEVVNGTLVIDMINPSTKSMMWRGMATKEIDMKAKPEERDKKANKAAAKVFKNYPPK
jgi:hypothetical protein